MEFKKINAIVVSVLAFLILSSSLSIAQVPGQMNYQGYLIDNSGTPLDGDYLMTFAIYNVQAGGTAVWAESQTVSVEDGIYNVILGQPSNELTPDLFQTDLYLGITIDSDSEMVPRLKLTATPFSMQSGHADDSDMLGGQYSTTYDQSAHLAQTDNPHNVTAEQAGALTQSNLDNHTTNESAHHAKTTSFSELTGQASDAQVPDTIARDSEISWSNITGIPTDIADGDNDSGGDITAVNTGTTLEGGAASGAVTLDVKFPMVVSAYSNKNPLISITNSYASLPGIRGYNLNKTEGSLGMGSYGVHGKSLVSDNFGYLGSQEFGAYGKDSSTGNYGYLGSEWYGIYGRSDSGTAVYGYSAGGTAGYFSSSLGDGLIVGQGNVGIGTTTPVSPLSFADENGDKISIWGQTPDGNRVGFGNQPRLFQMYTDGSHADIVFGWGSSSNFNENMRIEGTGNVGIGTTTPKKKLEVYAASGTAVYGRSSSNGTEGALGFEGYGVWGYSVDEIGVGAYSHANKAIQGWSDNDAGVYGFSNSDAGVRGEHSNGNKGQLGDPLYGVSGEASDTGIWGVRGYHAPTGNQGYIGSDRGGVEGSHNASGNWGRLGNATTGVYGHSSAWSKYTAGEFNGPVLVKGNLSKGGGSFKIDHPLDPENKYLQHSFVESPDMMNIYNGNAVLDEAGEAWVELPEWFEALNRDFRYQLTCIGGFAPVYIAERISDNRFKIAGGTADMEVSWQVTGIRQDPYADAHRIPVEEDKPEKERGYYLHPEAYGQPKELGVNWDRDSEIMQAILSDRHENQTTAEN